MSTALANFRATSLRCKCCGGQAHPFGLVDFHKNCEQRRRRVLEPSGVPIQYHQCLVCGFLFTNDFDGFTREDLLQHIYNEDYHLVDPDYQEVRPRTNAATLCQLFPGLKPSRLLDYGGGNGQLASLLRRAGFPQVETFDPFVPQFAARPDGRFDCILCFEVMEHAMRPAEIFDQLDELLDEPGLIVFSTLLLPADILAQGLSWWYVGPRNGHVSLYTDASLRALAQPRRLSLASFNEGMHVLVRGRPSFAQHFIP